MAMIRKTVKVGERDLIIETGRMAKQADGAAVVRYGDTMILATSVSAKDRTPAFAASSSSASGFITPYLKLNQLWQLRCMRDSPSHWKGNGGRLDAFPVDRGR